MVTFVFQAINSRSPSTVKAPRDVRLRLELGAVQLRIARFDSALRSYQASAHAHALYPCPTLLAFSSFLFSFLHICGFLSV
jgi:hypothetical protein